MDTTLSQTQQHPFSKTLKDPLMAKVREKNPLTERTTGDELRERERKRERDPKNCASLLITACLDSDDNISASMHTLENA